MDSDMYGSVKPYRRQVIISTGKYDWDSEITDTKGTLAAHLLHVNDTLGAAKKGPKQNGRKSRGIFEQSDAQRLSILNGSHNTICDDPTKETVIVFPDFKIVAQVPRSQEGAEHFWDDSLDPSYGRAGVPQEKSELKSWVLPYSCVIMLCSHKRRDKRCHITAPILAETFTQYLEKEGWEVHTQLEDVSHTTPLEMTEAGKSQEEKEESFIAHLKTLPDEHKVLIVRTSHFGGHKFAGNCVVCILPSYMARISES
ncbi:hypothetical protein SERLA73DRAFT_49993 [Serpula lacrymans var. lacrymans S7.3]|uniref:Uncharacterized protein n=1 Tax=Serpula lacrymans var. lacrymans (strain S7.3) TaxID=936435 RepID=F8PNJ3_SERL3|nr:hypothetical protein SERLA73DRAFT_49993 [Serpula lacrymans var. lacrymans S7.3]